jgi:hypothetical protein
VSIDENFGSENATFFKTVEFRSIGHLLEVCQDFHYELQNIEIPPPVDKATRLGCKNPCDDTIVLEASHSRFTEGSLDSQRSCLATCQQSQGIVAVTIPNAQLAIPLPT